VARIVKHLPGQHDQQRHDPTKGKMSDSDKLAWQMAINVGMYDRLQKVEHGDLLLRTVEDIPWRDKESFLSLFKETEEPVLEAKYEVSDKWKWRPSHIMWAISKFAKDIGGRPTAIEIPTLAELAGISTRNVEEFYESHFHRYFQAEYQANLFQWRLRGSKYRFDSKAGIITRAGALNKALKSSRYKSPEALYESVRQFIPKKEARIRVVKGGPGSGHFGHRGRPGKVGGSLPKGGPGKDIFYPTIGLQQSLVDHATGFPDDKDKMGQFLDDGLLSEEMWHRDAVTGEKIVDYPAWAGASYEDRGEVKNDLVTRLSEETGVDYDTVNDIVAQWAMSSNDLDMRSLSLQAAAAEEFGVDMSEWQRVNYEDKLIRWEEIQAGAEREIEDLFTRTWIQRQRFIDEGITTNPFLTEASREEIYNTVKESVWTDIKQAQPPGYMPITSRNDERLVLRAMYDVTQSELAKFGYDPDDTIVLWRGIGTQDKGKLGELANYKGNAIESWSISYKVANDFRQATGDMVGAHVPVRNILATCKTGFGCLTEGEVITFGNIPGMQVRIAEYIEKYNVATQEMLIDYSEKGGEGSGHHGHLGRPGKRGGSLPKGSLPVISSDKKDVELSKQLAQECDAQSKECYKNSVMALSRVEGGKYVEGYFVIDFEAGFQFPIEHGWIDKDGTIIDITLPDDEGIYIPANSWNFKEVMAKVGGTGESWLPFSNYRDENWRKAAVQAWDMLGVKIEKGGAGSGHHDHEGRPGKVGGSKPSKKRVVSSKYSTYTDSRGTTIYKVKAGQDLPPELVAEIEKAEDTLVRVTYNTETRNWHISSKELWLSDHGDFINESLEGHEPKLRPDDKFPFTEKILSRGIYQLEKNEITLYDFSEDIMHLDPLQERRMITLADKAMRKAMRNIFKVNGKEADVVIEDFTMLVFGKEIPIKPIRVVKHLPGQHDQQSHDPTKGKGKRVVASKGDKKMAKYLPTFVDNFAATDYENLFMVAPDGSFYENEGDKNSVSIDISPGRVAKFKNGQMVHNHPSGTPFSASDVHFAIVFNLKAIHVVGVRPTDGKFVKYTLKRGGDEWGMRTPNSFIKALTSIAKDVRMNFAYSVGDQTITPQLLNYYEGNELWRRFAKKFGHTYTEEIV
jgi:hypothetical protein